MENIETMENRVESWNSLRIGKRISFSFGSLVNHRFVYEELKKIKPDHIIHYGEQPSAPYSMPLDLKLYLLKATILLVH